MVSTKYSKLQELEDDSGLTLSDRYYRRNGIVAKMLRGGAVFLLVGILLALCSSIFVDGLGYPLHASCKIDWMFGVNCSTVSMDLVNQIKTWSGPNNCDQGGEKCLYSLVSVNSTILLAKHETPKQQYVDDLSFQFTQKGTNCAVHGYSTSETWYAVLDKGTNYCNLHNLITGSGLDETKGYTENTNDGQCTQFSSADCDVY
nr:uncharacterized protein LOC129276267 [Lytechinus pictus]